MHEKTLFAPFSSFLCEARLFSLILLFKYGMQFQTVSRKPFIMLYKLKVSEIVVQHEKRPLESEVHTKFIFSS